MMRQPWFKLYTEARTDPKVKKLTRDQHYVWFNLLCFAAEQSEQRGTIYDVDIELLALETADEDIELLESTIERLKKLRMVTFDDGILTFIHFMDRQYDNPSDRPDAVKERMNRHRKASKQNETTCNDNETTCNDNETTCNEVKRGETPREEEIREDKKRSIAQILPSQNISLDESFSAMPDVEPEIPQLSQKNTNITPTDLDSDVTEKPHKHRKRDPYWDAFMDIFPTGPTPAKRNAWNKAIFDIKTMHGTPEEIPKRCENYKLHFPRAAFTPSAIAANWFTCQFPPGSPIEKPKKKREDMTYAEIQAESERIAREKRELSERRIKAATAAGLI